MEQITDLIKSVEKQLSEIVGEEVRVYYVRVKRRLTLDDVLNEVLGVVNLARPDVRSKSRRREYVLARQLFYYYAIRMTQCSLRTIAEYVRRSDHSTVIHGIKTVQNLVATNNQGITNYFSDLNRIFSHYERVSA